MQRIQTLFGAVAAALAAGALVGDVAASAETTATLRAGVAKADITPVKPVMLAGYGSRKDLSQGVHDPLSARVVAFEQDGRRLVLVSADLLGFYGGSDKVLRKAILEACRLKPSELFLAAVHTHAGPVITLQNEKVHANNVKYLKMLQTRLVDVVREALAHTTPVQIGVATGSSPVGVNRRQPVHNADGTQKIVLGRNPAGPTDPEVQVLRVANAGTGDVSAVVFGYATHSTSLGPRNYLVSGDVHGLAEQFLEKHLGGNVVAPAFAGASGNIDPWFRVLPEFRTELDWVPEPVLLGTMLGEEVAHVLDRTRPPKAGGPIATAMKTLALPAKDRANIDAATGGESPEFQLTVGRIGDVGVVGLGGEVFSQLGKAIKEASPFPTTLIITHCNGAAGYVPTKEAYPEGGYEVRTSPFAPEAAEVLVREAVTLLREL